MANRETNFGIEASNGQQNRNSIEAVIESVVLGGTESTCNNAERASVLPEIEGEKKPLDVAEELMMQGSKAANDGDHGEATDCFSRALEIRVSVFGELAPECVNAYYKYGCALLCKAQEEADPLGSMPKKEADSDKDGPVRSATTAESSAAIISSNVAQNGTSDDQGKEKEPVVDTEEGKDQGEDEEGSDVEDVDEGDEDESDLDLAWKMLDLSRAIAEKHMGNTTEMVDILSALAEVSLEREDVETSLSDYLKALSTLEHLVEPDSRHLAELNFRICLCLEIGSRPEEAIPYCEKAISICKTRVQRLSEEVKSSRSKLAKAASESDQGLKQSSSTTDSLCTLEDKETEIKTLTGLSIELEKKLDDLQQLVLNPKSHLSEIFEIMAANAIATEKASSEVGTSSSQLATSTSNGGFESSTVSTAHTNSPAEVTDLGVVGRGVKRVRLAITDESSPAKRPATDTSTKTDGSNAS